jgi:hypothetical protein
MRNQLIISSSSVPHSSLPPAHLRQATKLTLKVKITATTSYSEGDYFPTIPSWNSIKEWPYNGHYFLFFMTAISADSSTGIYHNNSSFHGHKSPNNVWSFLPHKMPLSKGPKLPTQWSICSTFIVGHSCSFMPSLSLPWPIKGPLDIPYHTTPAPKHSPPPHSIV